MGPRAGGGHEFHIGAEHHLVWKPAGEDLSAEEALNLRHLVERAGLTPDPALPATHASPAPRTPPAVPGLLVAMDNHGAKVFQIDAAATDPARHTIKPYDPHGYLHHLAHKDEFRERGQRAAEDPSYYERIAQTVLTGTKGAARTSSSPGRARPQQRGAPLRREPAVPPPRGHSRTVTEAVADLSSLTEPQLLDLGRRAISKQTA